MLKEVDFQNTLETSFLTYAASVAQERAIPDVRDMLKIGLRQGLYAQFTNKHTHKDKFQKAVKSVSAAMGQSYVHGDVAMYDTFIRAARPWSYHYPLEETQGSAGDQTSPDSQSAMRYVELRASELADILFNGIKKNAIDEWYLNYDDTEEIPSVFPSIGYWNIVNGCSGIAVAMATSVPQFNLREVNEALIKIIKNPDVSFDEIYCVPDFSCGGTITNARTIKESIKNGSGESIRLRAKLEYFPDQNMIRATELPYGVFTDTINSQLSALTEENSNYGIENVVDHTKKFADIHIYLTKGANPKKMIEKLYHDTALENYFAVNMIMLDKGRFPKVFGWRAACDAYIEHIRSCKRNIIQYDLDKALTRKNIVDGLIKAYSILDEVIATIKASENPTIAATNLIAKFNFNEEQAKAILAMKLSSLTKLDIVKLESEMEELLMKIEQYNYLLNIPIALDNELIKTLTEVANKFGDERRTKIMNLNDSEEDIEIKEEDVAVMLFDNNMIRIIKKDELQGAKRGRKGTNIKPPKNANLINTLYATNLSNITAFTNGGRMYTFSINDIDLNKDYSIYELINVQDKEKVILLIDSTSFNAYKYIITVSKNGYVKKSLVSEYNVRAKKGTVAVKLEENDKLINVFLSSSNNDKVFIVSNSGNYNFYKINEISETGRATKGVKGIKLNVNEQIKTATIVKNDISYRGILTITTSGRGKITPINDFNETSRAIKGTQVMNLKDESIAVVYSVPETQEQLFVSANNKAVLLNINNIPIQGRTTMGISIIDARNCNTSIEIM